MTPPIPTPTPEALPVQTPTPESMELWEIGLALSTVVGLAAIVSGLLEVVSTSAKGSQGTMGTVVRSSSSWSRSRYFA